MTSLIELISNENPVFKAYAFWAGILVLKMLSMSYLTSRIRKQKQVVPNPEDSQFLENKEAEPKFGDPDVERVRRAHRNDLENCLPFMIIGFFYVLTDPSTFIAVNLFRAAAIARIVHTYVYAITPMQPQRAISYGICLATTVWMAIQTALYFC